MLYCKGVVLLEFDLYTTSFYQVTKNLSEPFYELKIRYMHPIIHIILMSCKEEMQLDPKESSV